LYYCADINIDGIIYYRTNDLLTVGKVLYVLIRGVNIDEERFNLVKEIHFVRNRIRDIRKTLLIRSKSTTPDKEILKIISSFRNR
jgi:hypothetical protein